MGTHPTLPNTPFGPTPGNGSSSPPRTGTLPQQPVNGGPSPQPGTPPQTPAAAPAAQAPAVCTGVPLLSLSCARLLGSVGPPTITLPSPTASAKPGPPANNYADVLLIQRLINLVVEAGYVQNAVLGNGNGQLAETLVPNGLWSIQLFNAIKQIELLYFHGRANPHGIGVIDPQADESLFVFLVEVANGGQKAHKQLSVQMQALAAAMVPNGMAKMDAGGNDPDGNVRPPTMTRIEFYLPGLLEALTAIGLNDTDWILLALACVRTETSTFVPHNEKDIYSLNTSGDFTDIATGKKVWTSDPATVHTGGNPKLLRDNYKAAVRTHHVPTETWSENKNSTPGDLYQTNKGLGNTTPGDGWLFRGRGFIQLTGRGTYQAAGNAAGLGNRFVDHPDSVNSEQFAGAAIAGYLKTKKGILEADLQRNDLGRLRHHVNGGNYGIDEFRAAFAAGRALIAQAVIHSAKMQVQHARRHKKYREKK